MSATHEALKRAREVRQKKAPLTSPQGEAVLTVGSHRPASAWFWWMMLFFVLAESALLVRENVLRRKAEEKMKLALYRLNDERGGALEIRKKKSEIEFQADDLRGRLRKAVSDIMDLSSAKRLVELENLEKEKRIAQLTKNMHEVEISKLQLKEELRELKKELSR